VMNLNGKAAGPCAGGGERKRAMGFFPKTGEGDGSAVDHAVSGKKTGRRNLQTSAGKKSSTCDQKNTIGLTQTFPAKILSSWGGWGGGGGGGKGGGGGGGGGGCGGERACW